MQSVLTGEPAHPTSPPALNAEPESDYIRGYREGWYARETHGATAQTELMLRRLARLADAAERHPMIRRFLGLGGS